LYRENWIPRAPRFQLVKVAKILRNVFFLACAFISVGLAYFTDPSAWPLWLAWGLVNLVAWVWEFVLLQAYSPDAYDRMRGDDAGRVHILSPRDFQRRHGIRAGLFFSVYALNLVALYTILSAGTSEVVLVAGLAIIYTLLCLSWMAFNLQRSYRWGTSILLWVLLAVFLGAAGSLGMLRANDSSIFDIAIGFFLVLAVLVIFIAQRLGVQVGVRADVINDLTSRLLGVSRVQEQWNMITRLVGERLRYDHVFILTPNPNRSRLIVMGEYGDYENLLGKQVPLENSLTGQAYLKQRIESWNNVSKCPYYYSMSGQGQDRTRAEIAVPIQHQDNTYAILDVQSMTPNVYRSSDTQALETIAHILGAAIASENMEVLIQEAYQLWEKLSGQPYNSEGDVFDEFAEFAQEKLGADVVTYYLLSPSGIPISKPFFRGNLLFPEKMGTPINDLSSPIIKLIKDWRPLFLDVLPPDSPLVEASESARPRFAEREQVRALCFIPVGTRQERLGVMFLNYRAPRLFDSLFKFMVISFSQVFAQLAARERYKNISFESFGRPELGMHSLIGRYGLKKGVLDEGEKIIARYQLPPEAEEASREITELLRRVQEFLQAASLAGSSIPPSFWRESLEKELRGFISTLPAGRDRPRPVVHLTLDPLIERENAWAKLALYRLVTEAVNNAVFHGEASEIWVEIRRQPNCLAAKISNLGHPLPQDSEKRQSGRGIFSLLKELRSQFLADTGICPNPDAEGTLVYANIPMLN
jgi:GAF domain-containing protein